MMVVFISPLHQLLKHVPHREHGVSSGMGFDYDRYVHQAIEFPY